MKVKVLARSKPFTRQQFEDKKVRLAQQELRLARMAPMARPDWQLLPAERREKRIREMREQGI